MSTQMHYPSPPPVPSPRRNSDHHSEMSYRTLNRNTSFISPPTNYTSRISCPTRQAFYKQMIEEQRNQTPPSPNSKKSKERTISQPVCLKHDVREKSRTSSPKTVSSPRARRKERKIYENRCSANKHVNMSRSYVNQEQQVYRVNASLPTVRNQASMMGSQRDKLDKKVSCLWSPQKSKRGSRPRVNHRKRSTITPPPVLNHGSYGYDRVSKKSSMCSNNASNHLKYGLFGANDGKYQRMDRSSRAPGDRSTRSANSHWKPEKETFVFPRVQTPVFIIPPVTRATPQYLTKSKIMHVDIEPGLEPQYRVYIPKGLNRRHHSNYPQYIDDFGRSYGKYHKDPDDRPPQHLRVPRSRSKRNIGLSGMLSPTSKSRAVSPYKHDIGCSWKNDPKTRKFPDKKFNSPDSRSADRKAKSPDRKLMKSKSLSPSPDDSPKKARAAIDDLGSRSDRVLPRRRKTVSTVVINRNRYLDSFKPSYKHSLCRTCSPTCNSIRKLPASSSSYRTMSPDLTMGYPRAQNERMALYTHLPTMDESQSQTKRKNFSVSQIFEVDSSRSLKDV